MVLANRVITRVNTRMCAYSGLYPRRIERERPRETSFVKGKFYRVWTKILLEAGRERNYTGRNIL